MRIKVYTENLDDHITVILFNTRFGASWELFWLHVVNGA